LSYVVLYLTAESKIRDFNFNIRRNVARFSINNAAFMSWTPAVEAEGQNP
jgi:hypothetical protein